MCPRIVADPSSTYVRQLETKAKLLEGDKLLTQVGQPWVDGNPGAVGAAPPLTWAPSPVLPAASPQPASPAAGHLPGPGHPPLLHSPRGPSVTSFHCLSPGGLQAPWVPYRACPRDRVDSQLLRKWAALPRGRGANQGPRAGLAQTHGEAPCCPAPSPFGVGSTLPSPGPGGCPRTDRVESHPQCGPAQGRRVGDWAVRTERGAVAGPRRAHLSARGPVLSGQGWRRQAGVLGSRWLGPPPSLSFPCTHP